MVDFNDFKDSINDSTLYTNTFTIESDSGALIVSANGTLGEYNSELLVGDELEKGCKSMFNSNLILSFFKLSGLADMVTLHMGTQLPMLLEVTDDLEEVAVELLIAPRIEEY